MIRCPLCMARVRVLATVGRGAWNAGINALADRIVASATFEDWAGRAEHLVTEHNWSKKLD